MKKPSLTLLFSLLSLLVFLGCSDNGSSNSSGRSNDSGSTNSGTGNNGAFSNDTEAIERQTAFCNSLPNGQQKIDCLTDVAGSSTSF